MGGGVWPVAVSEDCQLGLDKAITRNTVDRLEAGLLEHARSYNADVQAVAFFASASSAATWTLARGTDCIFRWSTDKRLVADADKAEHVARTAADTLGVDTKTTYSAASGRPADALIREAIRKEARVIVVGNRRMQGIGRVLGSVANSELPWV